MRERERERLSAREAGKEEAKDARSTAALFETKRITVTHRALCDHDTALHTLQ